MTVKIRVIDNRNQLFGFMKYQAVCTLPQFFEVRNWCWDKFGPGVEYEHYINLIRTTRARPKWAWDSSKYQGASISNAKIYLPDDSDIFSLFSLTWS